MKRPTRPFVVEVKKRRGSPAKPRSIWGDLDLSALAADPSAVTELTSKPVGNDRDTDPAIREDGAEPAIADATYAEPYPAEVEVEGGAEDRVQSIRKRVRRSDEPNLPRGQRWKRRLPKALRR
ncbi:hypothetical protein FY036_07840 [Mesorhizobium microcysteis]|uniref:Uncharacterized protein n=1 Tax=Neoaquamicrobium microcysteis TaxID=2682781 RepID=A0A5D4H0B1_9HYPH|nr:hypothetical protein [Mesorhizobium microcysteis]TYR33479.1 hypothetical protein FY036_07840 [Mesorhizobium microcysteis]